MGEIQATELYSEGGCTSVWASTVNGEESGRAWTFSSGPEEWWEGELVGEFEARMTNESFRFYGASVRGVIG